MPGFDAVRGPARLWLLVVLALAVVVAHGLAKLRRRAPRAAPAVTTAVCLGLLAEAWLGRLPLHAPPERFAQLEARAVATPVLELPLGSIERDLSAMYRATYHRAPLVNGYSGYTPASFLSLRFGLNSGDARALVPFSERMPLDIVIHSGTGEADAQAALVEAAGARLVTTTDRFRIYHLPQREPAAQPPQSPAAPVLRVTSATGRDATRLLADNDPFSIVFTDRLDVVLERRCRVDEVEIAAVPWLVRAAVRAPAADGTLHELWSGSVAETSVRAALEQPRLPRVRLRFAPVEADRLQLDLEFAPQETATAVSELRVFGEGCGDTRK